MSLKAETIKGVKWTSLAKVTVSIVALLRISILTRYLDSADFGLMSIVLFVIGFSNLFMDMGLTSAILHKQNTDQKTYASLYWLNLTVSIIIYGIILILAPWVTIFYELNELHTLIPLAGLSVIFGGIGRQFATILQKNLLFEKIAIIEITSAIISFFVAIYCAINGYGVYALLYSILTMNIISNLLLLISGVGNYGLLFYINIRLTLPYLKIGIYQMGSSIINYFNRDLDILIIGKLLGAEVLGGYSLAKQLVFKPTGIINPIITKVATPLFSKIQVEGERVKDAYLKLVNTLTTINFFLYAVMALFSYWIVTFLYGSSYIHIVSIVQVLSLYMTLRSIGNSTGSLIVAFGKTHLGFYWNLGILLLTPLVIYVGSFYDIVGIAFALFLYQLLLVIPAFKFVIQKLIPIRISEYLESLIPNYRLIKSYKTFFKN